jgi:hypothetical protein
MFLGNSDAVAHDVNNFGDVTAEIMIFTRDFKRKVHFAGGAPAFLPAG